MREYWKDPPEHEEPEVMDITQVIEIDLNQVVIVSEDGSWEYEDDSYDWAKSSDTKSGDYYSDEGNVYLTDYMGLVEKVDELIETSMPAIAGKYRISAYIELTFEVTNIEVDREKFPDGSEWVTHHGENADAQYIPSKSTVQNFKFEQI